MQKCGKWKIPIRKMQVQKSHNTKRILDVEAKEISFIGIEEIGPPTEILLSRGKNVMKTWQKQKIWKYVLVFTSYPEKGEK